MAKPYSTTAQVLNTPLAALATSAQWDVTELTGDVADLIAEGDADIDSRLAALGYALPFPAAPASKIEQVPAPNENPAAVVQLSILYARYACYRDLYAGGDPKGGNPTADAYWKRFEDKFKQIEGGFQAIVGADGAVVANSKYKVLTSAYPDQAAAKNVDAYPNYPSGPYPDPPGVGD